MFLKRIELTGFKSFAPKTEFVFAREEKGVEKCFGVTAVVGPNGSGKSNVADAIRWVMGEQSPKNLRGKKSHDVIFSGSKAKSRMNWASVSLVFDNKEKQHSIDFEEVRITRKMYRSGEGEYSINNSKTRLLDVIDLLASMGISKESQCVLNQGMSDAILSANPLERKGILEEAAGVKPYQIKRDRSLKKLYKTQENLYQVKQLLEEIEPRLRILKRQAKRAEQRKEVEEQLDFLEKDYYARVWKEFQQEKNQYEQIQEKIQEESQKAQEKVDVLSQEQEKLSQKIHKNDQNEKIRTTLSSIRRELSEVERKRSHQQGLLDAEKERKKHIKTYTIIPVDLPFVRKRLGNFASLWKDALEKIQSFTEMSQVQKFAKELQKIVQDIEQLEKDCINHSTKVDREDTTIQKEREYFEQNIQEKENAVEKLTREIQDLERKIQQEESAMEDLAQGRKADSDEYFTIQKKISEARVYADQVRERLNEQNIAFARLEVRMEDMAQEVTSGIGVHPEVLTTENEVFSHDEKENVERSLQRLKSKLALIGGIDPLVAQEYAETQERFDFLSKESVDLEEAMLSLEGIIREMDQRIVKDFDKAFVKINKEFDRYFKNVFGGGEANLKKITIEKNKSEQEDEEDEKEDKEKAWGVDISVTPPKKNIVQLSLLSGGERSLVSLALLFAIISYNPPPFVILDEVEAALDENNSRRFGELLKELSGETQFIVITHNRETMKHADVLYGVTMKEGISNLLSVRLDQISSEGKIKK